MVKDDVITQALTQFEKVTTEVKIAELSAQFMSLKINGIEDTEGYKKVHAARMVVKRLRIDTDKVSDGAVEDAKQYIKTVQARRNVLKGLLAPIEDYLQAEEDAIDEAKERIKKEAEEKAALKIQERIKKLWDLGMRSDGFEYVFATPTTSISASPDQVAKMTDEAYQALYDSVVDAQKEIARLTEIEEQRKKAEAEEIAKVKAEQEVERKRLAKIAEEQAVKEAAIKEEQEAKEAELKAERERLEADKKAVEEAKQKAIDDKKREDEAEQERKRLAEQAKIDAEHKIKEEADAKAEADRVAKIEAELAERMKPDNEKLESLAATLETLPMPELAYEQSHEILTKARNHIARAINILRGKA